MEKNTIERCLLIYRHLLDGGRFTSRQLQVMLSNATGQEPHIRSIQRDLQKLRELPALGIEEAAEGNERYYSVNKIFTNIHHAINVNSNEVLSLYILKAYLKTFKGTTIENITNELFQKLSKFAPQDIFFEGELFWDKNIGNYDYSTLNHLIDNLINIIKDKLWVDVKYDTAGRGVTNEFRAFFRQIFTYAGYMYIIAYIPAHEHDIALAIHRIEDLKILDIDDDVPAFDKTAYSKNRFGVYEAKPEKVVLKISPSIEKYFLHRFWHQSQNLKKKDGHYYLSMKVPVTYDFISWVMSWIEGIEIIKPESLRHKVIVKMEKALDKYISKEMKGSV